MAIESEALAKATKKHKRNKSRVGFEEELINKEKATEVLAKIHENESKEQKIHTKIKKSKKSIGIIEEQQIELGEINNGVDIKKKKKKKSEKGEQEGSEINKEITIKKEKKKFAKGEQEGSEINKEITIKKEKKKFAKGEQEGSEINKEITIKKEKKQKKNKSKPTKGIEKGELEKKSNKRKIEDVDETEEGTEQNDDGSVTPAKTEESIRSKKRRKHEQLMEEQRKKVQIATQENVLNYLSKWKHARDEWKFEKLKQIWLSENLFDSSKLPDEFWEMTVDYFSGSKGFIRNLIIREALKIVEKEDKSKEENLEEEYQSRLKRARDIIQNLQE